MDKYTVMKMNQVEMKDIKKGDRFLLLIDGSIVTGIMQADADGYTNEQGIGAVDAHDL